VAFCGRDCNTIGPFICASGNRNESPLLRETLPGPTQMVHAIGIDLQGSTVSLDGVYDCRVNSKAIFNRGMVPNIPDNPRGRKTPKRGRKQRFDRLIVALLRGKPWRRCGVAGDRSAEHACRHRHCPRPWSPRCLMARVLTTSTRSPTATPPQNSVVNHSPGKYLA
jgi:hypothetical protein